MQAGALGLSTGLEYDPGIYSAPSEIVTLAKAVAPFGGRYISHIRSEDRDFWKALAEAIDVGRQAKIPVQISHVKLAMRSLWGQHAKLLATLNAARKEGVRVTADIYPYTYWQSGMSVLFPARDFANRASAEFALREVTSPEGLLVVRFARGPVVRRENPGRDREAAWHGSAADHDGHAQGGGRGMTSASSRRAWMKRMSRRS